MGTSALRTSLTSCLTKEWFSPHVKVNQSIWTDDQFVDGIPHEGHVTSIKITNGYNAYYCSFDEFPVSFAFVDDDIGKTIFFTREEAEKALEKGKI